MKIIERDSHHVEHPFQKELLEFQQKALLFAARHVNKRGGVFIGTLFESCAYVLLPTRNCLVRLFENEGFERNFPCHFLLIE